MPASTLVSPLLIAQPFGFSAANPTYIKLPIPVPSQIGTTINAASFTDGFPPSTMTPEASGGLPFFGQEMNGILWMVTAYCANFAAGAIPTYNSTLSTTITGYPVGVMLANAGGNGFWVNQTAGNTTNPDAGGAGWLLLASVGGTTINLTNTDVTVSTAQSAFPYLRFAGALTGNVNVILPANEAQQWLINNNTTGAFTVTVKTAAGTGVVIPATGAAAPTSIYCDGVNIQNTGISTAGLAPINSPALTGTPTAPTASPATTNTTQIATTAFVQAAITAALSLYATKASPIFSGAPTAPTAAPGTNTLQLATTAFVKAAVAAATTTIVKGQTITLAAGANSVAFPVAFPTSCDSVTLTPFGSTGAEYFVTAKNTAGFNVDVAVSQQYGYTAVGS